MKQVIAFRCGVEGLTIGIEAIELVELWLLGDAWGESSGQKRRGQVGMLKWGSL